MEEKTREPQYQYELEIKEKYGLAKLGIMTNQTWHDDPRRLSFVLARYKFAAKMLSGKKRVIEIGCGDAFATRIVQQEVEHVTVMDFDPVFIKDVIERMNPRWPVETLVHNMLDGRIPGDPFDAAYALDVLEHILPKDERQFISNIVASLKKHGMLILGMPSIQSQPYASRLSKEGHVNCKDASDFRALMQEYFHHVFVFSMNDEVVHTGFSPMANYLIAVCCEPKSE
jgi:cyclopropane fatty-acyl-phospholipid synthase-like methyltransferase